MPSQSIECETIPGSVFLEPILNRSRFSTPLKCIGVSIILDRFQEVEPFRNFDKLECY